MSLFVENTIRQIFVEKTNNKQNLVKLWQKGRKASLFFFWLKTLVTSVVRNYFRNF